jgi:hypothetical protein
MNASLALPDLEYGVSVAGSVDRVAGPPPVILAVVIVIADVIAAAAHMTR